MAFDALTVLAVVPARGGSKGIPGKNLRVVGGHSLVGHAARLVASLNDVDAAVLSTDDRAIMEEAQRYGLVAPFTRPDEISGDKASSVDMWRHAWLAAEDHFDQHFDLSILLEPTSPMRQAADVQKTLAALTSGNHAAAATVSLTPAHYAPQKTLTVDPQGYLGFYDVADNTARRQDIPRYYHRNGLCYAVRRETLITHRQIIEKNCCAVIIDRPVVNIDEPFDLEFAEFLMLRNAHRNGETPA